MELLKTILLVAAIFIIGLNRNPNYDRWHPAVSNR